MATGKLVIEGAEQEVSCDCCNRKLKVGVRTNLLGTIGADCFIKHVAANRTRYSGNGLPTASWVRELAVIQETKSSDWKARRGLGGAHHWAFDMKEAA